jgi:hypothetical protein
VSDTPSFDWAPRPDWIKVEIVRNKWDSWDIVLNVDGGYTDREMAEWVAEFFSRISGRPLGDRLPRLLPELREEHVDEVVRRVLAGEDIEEFIGEVLGA